ncbi:hypothetical protein NHX12_034032 [Muraenolepis orangiensis]|uniref:Uncharacterized protein n=1 Tax=Muraenolepis orangiensis TaxID=630683 RepID=A0A9Q0E753_9TELE|nr:hypothetical protein NHX12_034032 [Muraenolepis orangiensis]
MQPLCREAVSPWVRGFQTLSSRQMFFFFFLPDFQTLGGCLSEERLGIERALHIHGPYPTPTIPGAWSLPTRSDRLH